MNALILDAENKTANVQHTPLPTPTAGEVIIRVIAVALNPVDSLYVFNPLGNTGRTVGSDFAGIVINSGSDDPSTTISTVKKLEVGTRVAGFLQGACSANTRPGAFAEYLICPSELTWRIPSSMTFEEAATISLCALTAAQALFYRLKLPTPFPWSNSGEGNTRQDNNGNNKENDKSFTFFIYGATTSVGLYAAQLIHHSAAVSGRSVKLIGAASPARWSMLKAKPYNYDTLVDYRDTDWPSKVKSSSPNGLGVDFVYDCISEGSTVQRAASTLCEDGRMAIVRSKEGGAFDITDLKVEAIYGAVWEGLGEEVHYQNMIVAASEDAKGFAMAFYKWLSGDGEGDDVKLVANPTRLMPGGLQKIVPDGFALLGGGSMGDRQPEKREEAWMKPISAEKLVYKITES